MTTSRRRRRPARHLTAALVAVAALALAGCSATNEITTLADYDASDGVGVELGDLDVANLLVLTAAEGSPGTVIGSVTNRGSDDIALVIGLADGEGTELSVAAGSTVALSPEAEAVGLAAVPAAPGALVALLLTSDAGGSTSLEVPVLDGTLAEYAPLVPQG